MYGSCHLVQNFDGDDAAEDNLSGNKISKNPAHDDSLADGMYHKAFYVIIECVDTTSD